MKDIFAVYKPKGPTSNQILTKIRKRTGIKKVGHAGTLDPLAQGILVVGVGRAATKQLGTIVAKEKEYLATIRLGYTSTTDDNEGQKEKIQDITKPLLVHVKNTLKQFKGEIDQVPPIYSAIKIKGQEAYKLARKGKEVKMKSRKALIKKISLISYKYPYLKIEVVTGPGVYIRSLARDIGQVLGTGGYLSSLERTRVGRFTKNKALKLNQIKKAL
ncbi:TPA: tRNA pseudouridine(55) synthase TruB [Patescibacteria group bacterium]|nr:tRNA pseudouridine(55) synthase TruB [Patescibacteria group bacterium]